MIVSIATVVKKNNKKIDINVWQLCAIAKKIVFAVRGYSLSRAWKKQSNKVTQLCTYLCN